MIISHAAALSNRIAAVVIVSLHMSDFSQSGGTKSRMLSLLSKVCYKSLILLAVLCTRTTSSHYVHHRHTQTVCMYMRVGECL